MDTVKIGCDLGMSSVKLVGEKGDVQFLSQAALYGGEVANFGGRRKKPVIVEGDFGKLYVGQQAHIYGYPVESLAFERLAGTNEVRAVFYGAMTKYMKKYGIFSHPLVLLVGLPFQMLMGETAQVLKYKNAVNAWMSGSHEWIADGVPYRIQVDEARLYPQALGAMADYAFDMAGQVRSADHAATLKKECACVSIGSNTVELLVTKQDQDTKRFCGGKPVGVRSLWRRVDKQQWTTFGEFDQMLRAGSLPEELDVSSHLDSWAGEITGFADSIWAQSFNRFHRIFVVGGGAILLKRQLRGAFNGKASVLDDPVMAIGLGLYKLGLLS